MAKQIFRFILLALIPVAIFEAAWIMPGSDYYKPMDFAVFYTASHAFLHGENPYDRSKAQQAWEDAGGDYDVMDMVLGAFDGDPDHAADHWLPIEVIPPGLVVFGAFSVFRADTAWTVWNVVVGLLLLGQIYATIRLMNRPFWHPASVAMIVLTALLEPLHIGIANGQPTVPTVSLLVMCLWFSRSNKPWIAGICFAIATALKPQLAAPFVLLLLYQRRFKTVFVAAGLGLALTLIGAGFMQVKHPEWLPTWVHEVRYAEQSDGIDDARTNNVGRHDLLYLALIGHLFTDNATIVNIANFTTFAALTAGLFYAGRWSRDSLAVIAAFSVLTLMPMYHRYYDAFILVLPISWALLHLKDRLHWLAGGVLAVVCCYFVSEEWLNQSVFRAIGNNYPIAAASFWFNDILEPHHAWELLGIFGLLFASVMLGSRLPTIAAEVGFVPPGWWRQNAWRLAVSCLIPLALLEAYWLAPDPDYYKPMDFAMYYTAGRMFEHGANPYDRKHAEAVWQDADETGDYYDVMDMVLGASWWDDEHAAEHWLPVNLMPAGLTVMSAVAWMDIQPAWVTWNVVISLLLLLQIRALAGLMKTPVWHWRTLVVVALMILLEPLHIGIANGQPAVPAVALVIISLWLGSIDRQILAGISIALATALKPQLGGPFVIYFLWRKQWKLVGVAATVGVLLTLSAIVPMQAHGLPWLKSWLGEIKYAEIPGGINDPRISDGGRHDMMHLQVFFHTFTDNELIATTLTLLLVLALGGALLGIGRDQKNSLLAMSCFCVLALMPAYHRLYDAGVLIVPIAWAVCNFSTLNRWPARFVLLIGCAYFISEEWLDQNFLAASGQDWSTDSWWFNTLAEPHHAIEMLAMIGCLMWAISPKRNAVEHDRNTSRLATE